MSMKISEYIYLSAGRCCIKFEENRISLNIQNGGLKFGKICNRFHYFDTFPTGRERRRTWFFRHAKFTTDIFGHRGRGRTKNNLVFPKSPVSRHPCRFSHKVGNPSIFRPFSIDRETRLNRHFTNSKSSSENGLVALLRLPVELAPQPRLYGAPFWQNHPQGVNLRP